MTDHVTKQRSLLAKNSIFNLIGMILPMFVGVVTIPSIIHGLGADGYGILSISWLVLGYFSIFDLGLSSATVKFVSENLSPEKIHKVPELVWTSLSLLVGLGCVGAVLTASLVPYAVTHFFKMSPSFTGQARSSLFILCLALPILLANDSLRGVLEVTQRFYLVNIVKVPSSILFCLLAALVIPFNVHVTGIVCLLVLVRLISSFAYLSFCFREIPELRRNIRVSRAATRPLAVYGGWVMLTNIVSPIFGSLERFMIASIISVGMLTYYSAPYDLVSKLLIFPASIVPSLFPYFSFHGSRSGTEVSEVTSRVIKYLTILMVPLTAVFVFFAREILQLWLGPQFAQESARVLQRVAILFFLNAFAMIPFTTVQALGRPELKAILDLFVLPFYAFIAWWLMKRMGINGAALAKLIITIIDCTFLYWFARRLNAFSLRDCFFGPLSRTFVVSGVLCTIIYLIKLLHASIPVTVILLTLSFLCFFGVCWSVSVDNEDRATLKAVIHQFLGGLKRKQSDPTLS